MFTLQLFDLVPGFALNSFVMFLIVRFIYRHSNPKNRDFGVTLFSFSVLVYLVISVLNFLNLNQGMGFGLLAVFATMNLRSVNLPVKEITYLFVAITLAMFNSLFSNTNFTLADLVLVNSVVFIMIFVVERKWGGEYEPRTPLIYEKIEMVRPEKYQELLEDIRKRTGLDVTRVEVTNIDFLRDVAEVLVFYRESAQPWTKETEAGTRPRALLTVSLTRG